MQNSTQLNISSTTLVIILCLISSAARFVIDSSLPSFPSMSDAFNISGNNIQLTLTLYLAGFGISQLIYGPLSDRWGRKKILMIGLVIFLAANILVIFSHSFFLLLASRLAAGIGMGACGVLNRAIASDAFHGPTFSKVWSQTTTALVATLLLAPIIGSIVQAEFGWQANFTLSTLYIAIILCIVAYKLPETHHYAHRLPSLSLKKIVATYSHILKTPSFAAYTFCYTFAFAGLTAYFQISPLLFMETFGLTTIEYGLLSALIAVCYFIGGQIVTQLAHKVGTQPLLLAGLLLMLGSSLIMLIWNYYFPPSIISTLLPIMGYVIGVRLVIPNTLSRIFSELRQLAGSASGLVGNIQMLGAACISLIIAQCDYQTPLPLALTLGLLSLTSLFLYFFTHK